MEKVLDYIQGYGRPETIVSIFYRRVDSRRNESYHSSVSGKNQNQTCSCDAGSSTILSKSKLDTLSSLKNDFRQLFGRYVEKNQIHVSVELSAFHENHGFYLMNDLVYGYLFKALSYPDHMIMDSFVKTKYDSYVPHLLCFLTENCDTFLSTQNAIS